MSKCKRYLITGGAGFIGSHLAEGLLKRGHEVYVIDNLTTGSIENIRGLKSNKKFTYYIDNVNNKALTSELIDGCDVIYHLAATVGVKLIVEQPVETIRNNIYTTDTVLQLAAVKKKMVIVASTSEVYGKGVSFPFKEDQDLLLGATIFSRWSYACSKILDEFLTLAYHKYNHLPAVIVRLFNTVGPRQTGKYGMVVPTFIRQAIRGEPITIYGTGKQSRCFIHVDDAVNILAKISESHSAVGEIINVGSNQEISIEDLARLIKDVLKSDSPIHYISYDEAYEEGFEDMFRRVPDISKLKALIGVEPSMDIKKIIYDVAEYIKRTL